MKFAINLGEVSSKETSIKNINLEIQVSGGELSTAYSTIKQAISFLFCLNISATFSKSLYCAIIVFFAAS